MKGLRLEGGSSQGVSDSEALKNLSVCALKVQDWKAGWWNDSFKEEEKSNRKYAEELW